MHTIGKTHGPDAEREFSGLYACDVQRAFDQRQQMLTAALDDTHRLLAVRRYGPVLAHQLRITQDAVERRAQLMADGTDVAAFGLVRMVGNTFGFLQRFIGLPVRLYLAHQQVGLPVRLFLRHLPALVRQHQPPGHQPRSDQQSHVGLQEAGAQGRPGRFQHGRVSDALRQRTELLVVEQAKHAGQQGHDHQHQQQEMPQPGIEVRPGTLWQQPAQCARPLHRQAGVRFAHVAAARIQRAAQRADRPLVGRAMGHVRAFIRALTDHALLGGVTFV